LKCGSRFDNLVRFALAIFAAKAIETASAMTSPCVLANDAHAFDIDFNAFGDVDDGGKRA